MPKRILTAAMNDFQGGLNLNADPFQLGKNATADCLNVDFDPLGGFAQRDAAVRINTTGLTSKPKSMWGYYTPDGSTRYAMVQQGNSVAYGTGGNFTQAGAGAPFDVTTTGVMHGATFRNPQSLLSAVTAANVYIQRNAEQRAVRWDGSTFSALVDPAVSPVSWSPTIGTQTYGRMPKAKFITAHRNYVFVAHVTEDTKVHSSRIRWSHNGQPEDWRVQDYIDIEPAAGDAITGIASWNDRLLIFKNNAVFMLLGYDQDTFEVVNVSRTVGAVSQEAIAVCENGVFFFSWPEGVYFYNGRGLEDMFGDLRPMLEDGTVDRSQRGLISLIWLKQRLYLNVPTDITKTNNTETYVFDPALTSRGAWTRYQFNGYGLVTGMEWTPPSYDSKWLAVWDYGGASNNDWRVVELHVNQSDDQYATDHVPISTRYQTPWMDLGSAAVVKSWRRPVLVLRGGIDYDLSFTLYTDYDNTVPVKSFTSGTAGTTGSPLVWDSGLWDVNVWGADSGQAQEVVKADRLGRAIAVSLLVQGPNTLATAARWGVNSITWKYIPKRIRS